VAGHHRTAPALTTYSTIFRQYSYVNERCQPCEFPREIRFGIRFSSCVVTDDLHPVQDITASCRYKKEISGSNKCGTFKSLRRRVFNARIGSCALEMDGRMVGKFGYVCSLKFDQVKRETMAGLIMRKGYQSLRFCRCFRRSTRILVWCSVLATKMALDKAPQKYSLQLRFCKFRNITRICIFLSRTQFDISISVL
jgi:hypothetical protein